MNLDPTFSERALMESGAGLRGLPLVRLENIAGGDRLTIEFVRRTNGSGANLAYTPEFSSDLETVEAVGTETDVSNQPALGAGEGGGFSCDRGLAPPLRASAVTTAE